MSSPPKVFISYARKDIQLKKELDIHLEGLIKRGVISTWHDGQIVPGHLWNQKIVDNLDKSHIMLLLISPAFITSAFIEEVELKRASERFTENKLSIIPILGLNVHDWQSTPFGTRKLGDFQALPRNGEFIADSANPDAVLTDIVKGIEEAVKKLPNTNACVLPNGGRPPATGFVPRLDAEGRDILERLIEELAHKGNQLVTLSGMGGAGKTVLAIEAACAIRKTYGTRIVWSDVEGRTDYTLVSLLDDIAGQLGRPDLAALLDEETKASEVRKLVGEMPTLIVLDSYEQVASRTEQGGKESAGEAHPAKEPISEPQAIKAWFKRAECSALFVSREMDTGYGTVYETINVFVPHMSQDESLELIDRLVKQTRNPGRFTPEIRLRIYETAEGLPALMRWIVALIGLGRQAKKVFEDVRKGEGEAPKRVFDSSFNLAQVGEDGRATLLALTLFKPSATVEALTVVAGFGDDEERLLRALDTLFKLELIEGADTAGRYQVRGLTLSMAAAHLPKSKYAIGIWQRFVAYFKAYALTKYDWSKPENAASPRIEKSNILRAMQVAPCLKDWDTVMELFDVTLGSIHSFGVWREAIKLSEQYAEQKIAIKSHAAPIIIEIHHKRKKELAVHYESLHNKLSEEKRWKRIVLSAVKYELGVFAYDAASEEHDPEKAAANYALAKQRFEEAKVLKMDIGDKQEDKGDKLGVAISCNNLGVVIAREGGKNCREEAEKQFREGLKYLDDFMNPTLESRAVAARDKPEESLCTVGESRASKKQGMRFEKVIYLNLKWLEKVKCDSD